MLQLTIYGEKKYMGNPVTLSHLTLSDLERSDFKVLKMI